MEILYQSEHYLVINKPHDTLINSNDPKIENSVQAMIYKIFPNLANPKLYHGYHFVHRLDYATSGVMCIALNKKAAQAASIAFEKRTVQKYYLAILNGHVLKSSIVIDIAIGNDTREMDGNHKMCTVNNLFCNKPRKSCTALLVLERGLIKSRKATKVLLCPKTGRRHQLRVHCKHIGHTIIGDYTYSDGTDTDPQRTYLHAHRLIINNNIEDIDVQTSDPFLSTNIHTQWKSTNVVQVLDKSAFFNIQQLLNSI